MKKGPLETYRTPRLSRARKNTWRDAHPLPFNLSTCDFCALFQKKHHLMQRSYQKHPLLWKVVFFPIHPSKVLLETKFNNPISCHIIIFFQTTVLQFWRFLDPMLTFLFQWVKRGFLWLHLTFISGSEMRLAQMCDAPGGSTKKHRSPSSRHELCSCAGEIHIFVKILGSKFGLVLLDTHKRFILIFWMCFGSRVYSVQLMSIRVEGPCCPHGWCLCTQLRVWFQLPENCLGGDTRSGH